MIRNFPGPIYRVRLRTDLPRLHRVKLACIWLVDISKVSLRSAHPFVLQFEYTINQVRLFCLVSDLASEIGWGICLTLLYPVPSLKAYPVESWPR